MRDDRDDPRRYTKAWVRDNWDDERGTARKSVQLVKLCHEWHPLGIGVTLGAIPALAFWAVGTPIDETLAGFFATTGTVSGIAYQLLWCSVVADATPSDDGTEGSAD